MNSKTCVLSCLWCALIVSTARSAVPSVESLWPPVGQRGSEFELRIVGSGFEGCRELTFYSTELRCTKLQVVSDYELTATVVASETCRIGNEPFRVLGRDGYSELRTLRVTPLPVVLPAAAPKTDNGPPRGSRRSMGGGGFAGMAMTAPAGSAKSQVAEPTLVAALNVTLCGAIKAGSVDRYAVDLKAGQRLTRSRGGSTG